MQISKLEFRQALLAIKQETRPIEDHDDPGAINDCWATVEDYLDQEDQNQYFSEFEVIDGINQHPDGLTFSEWMAHKPNAQI